MNKFFSIVFFFLLFMFSTSAQDCNVEIGEDDIVQIAEGYGSSRSEALEYAKRKAIDQAVGSYMLTETQTINDDIDYDRIREFAKGLVKDWCQIADGYDGYERMIKIKAVVAKEMVYETLMQAGYEIVLNTRKIGDNLKQELELEVNQTESVKQILKEIKCDNPFIYELKESGFGRIEKKVGTQKTYDKTGGVIKLNIAIKPNFGNYLKTLENSLRNISLDSYKDDMVFSFTEKDMIYFPFKEKNDIKSSSWQSNKLIFINEIKESSFESNKLSKFYKRQEISKKGKIRQRGVKGNSSKEKFLKMFKGQNLHVNASIMSFEDPTLVYDVKETIKSKISGDYFKISIEKKNSSEIVAEYYGFYDFNSGQMILDGLYSDEKIPEQRKKKEDIQFVRNEYLNYNYFLTKNLSSKSKIRYLSNQKGSYNKQKFISTASILASIVPFVYALNKYNTFESSVSAHGFSSDYNPHQTLYDASIIASLSGLAIFGGWRWGLSKSPFTVLKPNNKEDVTIFCSDSDFLKSSIILNAEKQGLIDRTHEVFSWDILNEEFSNTISIFYTEIPIGSNQMSDDFKSTISSISSFEYNDQRNNNSNKYKF